MANKKFVAKNGIAVGTGHTTTDIIDQDGHITANTVTISGTLLNATAFAGTANNASYLEGSNGSYYTGYADNKAANAYSNAIAYSANATNISSGTLTANVLPTSGVAANTYGNSSSIPVITIDATGRITSATTNAVAGVTGFTYTPSNATFIITTGAGSTFPASISSANDSVAGIVKVLDSVSNTDIYIAASANSVKTAYDNATTAYSNAATYADNKAANAYSNATSYAASIAGTAYSNATTFASSAAATAYSNAVSAASSSAATAYSNATTFAANATNISSGTLAELRLPFRMDQNVRTNDTVSFGNMTITGNLTVTGTTVTVNANNLSVQDNMIYLNSNSSITNPDLGIAGNYNDGTYRHAGFFRDASDGVWKVFDQYLPEPDASPYIDTANASFRIANFQANVVTAASFSGNGASVTSVDAATVGGNTAGTLRSYSDSTAATAYSNATSYAASIAATAYSNAVSAASSSAATAYSNAVSYAASVAGTAYSNATSYAATIAGTAYSNAVSYFTTNSAIAIKYDFIQNTDLNGTGTTNALTSFNAYFPGGGGYNQPVGGGQHFRVLQFGRYNAGDSNFWRGQIAQSFYEDRMWFRKEYSQTWGSWQELWHTGNDGSGSGLDADTLDGQQGSYYAVDADVVKLTGTQTITGTKTFSGAASAPFRLLATNAVSSWDAVTFQATTEWGDGTAYGVLGGDGTEGIMLRRPHVVWNGDHASADIRLGRSGGTSGGGWVNFGIKASNVGFIGYTDTNVLTFSGTGSRITAVNGVDAPIFYDSANTSFYVDPASGSRLSTVTVGNSSRTILIGSQDEGNADYARIRTNSSGSLMMDSRDGQPLYLNWWSGEANHIISESASRFPTYYDRNDTGYYANPASTSLLNYAYGMDTTFTSPGSKGTYVWVRAAMGGFNAGGDIVKFTISRSINDNDSVPYGGPSAEFTVFSREWHSGQDFCTVTYGEHGSGSGAGGFYIANAGPKDQAGGGYWFYMKLEGGITYKVRREVSSGYISNFSSTTDPGGIPAIINWGFNVLTTQGGVAGIYSQGTIAFSPAEGNDLFIGNDSSYGASGTGRYITLGYGSLSDGGNRIFAHNTGEDGIYICSASSRAINFRPNGGGTNQFYVGADGISYSATSFRAPIFYDTANTSYYIDPASTTNINALTTSGQTILGGQIYVSATNTNTLNSGYGAASTADIWINYRGYADGQSYYRNTNIGDGRGNNIAWFDGENKRMSINKGQSASYNLDVSGTGAFTGFVGIGGSFGSDDGSWGARLNVGGAPHARIDARCTNDGIITTMYSHQGQNRGFVGTMSNHRLALAVNGSEIQSLYSSYSESIGHYRAPAFYDTNTTYYCDPDSYSSLWGVAIRGDTSSTSGGNQIFFWGSGNSTTSAIGFKQVGGVWAEHGRTNQGYNTYFTMDTAGRGWVFRLATVGGSDFTGTNVFSISNSSGITTVGSAWGTSATHAQLNVAQGVGGSAVTYRDIDLRGSWGAGEGHAISAIHGSASTNMVGQMVFEHNSPESRIKWGRLYHSQDIASYPMQLISNDSSGNARLEMSAGSDMRAPIFYDSANTSYYVDPGSGSSLKYLRVDGDWNTSPFGSGHANFTVTGTYASMYQTATNGSQGYMLHHIASDGSYYMYGGRGAINGSAWDWGLRVLPSQDGNQVEFRTSARAPIFYDSNDTGYYIDPNSTSNSALRVRGGALYGPNVTWGAYLYVGTDGRVGSSATVAVTNGNLHMDCQNGYAMYLNWYSNNNIYTGTGVNFGIGSDSASYKLHVHGTIYSTSNIIAASDERLKENVLTIENAIEKIKQIRGVTYTRNDLEDKVKRHAGVIAQEVEKVLPEVVDQTEDGIKNVAYGNMVGLLIEAIKEQQKQIEELKAALLNK